MATYFVFFFLSFLLWETLKGCWNFIMYVKVTEKKTGFSEKKQQQKIKNFMATAASSFICSYTHPSVYRISTDQQTH